MRKKRSMGKVKDRLLICIVACLFLISASACSLISNNRPQQQQLPREPITGDYVVIEDREDSRYFLIDSPADLEALFAVLPSAKMLKEHPSHCIYVIENGSYKTSFNYYENTFLYEDWGEEPPLDLIKVLGRLLCTENEVFHFSFLANDPTQHAALMDRLNEEEGLDFYYPSPNIDVHFSYITLYYECSDMSLERIEQAPIGTYPGDHVFIPVVEYLEEQGLLYKECDVSFYLGAYSSTPQYFGRRVELLVNRPLTDWQLAQISGIMQDCTNKEPYLIYGRASGAMSYTEIASYPIEMITRNDISEVVIATMKERYGLK